MRHAPVDIESFRKHWDTLDCENFFPKCQADTSKPLTEKPTLLRSIRELRSQGKPLPTKLENQRQIQKITSYQSQNPPRKIGDVFSVH